MPPLERLELMLEDMVDAPSLYRPTQFWQTGLSEIVDDLRSRGFEDFRRHPSALKMYVPSHCSRAFRRSPQNIQRMSKLWGRVSPRLGRLMLDDHSGLHRAQKRHLVWSAADPGGRPALTDVSESSFGHPVDQVEIDGRRYSASSLNYLRGLAFLKKLAEPRGGLSDLRSVLEVGGGYGTLGEIVLQAESDIFYVDVDIPPVAAVASAYLEQTFGRGAVLTYENSREMTRIDLEELRPRYRAAVLCPWQLPRLEGSFELFVNFISFQEMEPEVVRNYSSFVERLVSGWVLLRNSRAGKDEGASGLRVAQRTPMDAILDGLPGFEAVGRDHRLFGDMGGQGFISEVVALQRREARAASPSK